MDGLPQLPRKIHRLTLALLFAQCLSTSLALLVFDTDRAVAANRAASANANEDDGEVEGYDAIIHGLNREYDRPANLKTRSSANANDGLDAVWFHAGVGFTTMMEALEFDDGSTMYLTMKGLQVAGGIDLFSQHWRAEGTLRNFGETSDQPTHVSLQEFELKLLFHDRINPQLGFHAGAGLSARYMTIHRPVPRGAKAGGLIQNSGDYVTPTSVATGGFDFLLNERITLGFELAARSALVAETIDRTSLDATLRMDLQL